MRAKSPAKKTTSSASKPDFAPVFRALRTILAAYEPKLAVVHDTPDTYYLDTYTARHDGKRIMFAAVKIQRNYVSYYFMPIYGAALGGMSPALKKRMQGKACFNFTEVDKPLLKELKDLTKRGYQAWKKIEWVD